jgi:hypothetical protein
MPSTSGDSQQEIYGMNDLSINPPHPTNMDSDHHLESFEVETPSLDDIESVIDGLFLPVNRSITPADIRKDLILSAIAKQQALVGKGPFTESKTRPKSMFKATPAPAMGPPKVGPRMTKTAALRMGVPWEEPKRAAREAREQAGLSSQSKGVSQDKAPSGAAGHTRGRASLVRQLTSFLSQV